jgi:hypothetical protein
MKDGERERMEERKRNREGKERERIEERKRKKEVE